MTALAVPLFYGLALVAVCASMVATACISGDPWQRPSKRRPLK